MTLITALDFDPFQGDFGSQGDRTLKDALVSARKEHECTHCGGPIAVNEKYRVRADIVDGDLMSWKWCALCCEAMVEQMITEENADGRYPFDNRSKEHS